MFFSGTKILFDKPIVEMPIVFSALLFQDCKEEKEVLANYPHQTVVQRFPIRESSSLHIHLTATHKPDILLNIKHAGRTGWEQRCDCNGTKPQAACVGTWETGVEVILTRCWNSRLRIRFCCSKSNTRVRSFTHSSFKSWKRRRTELNWTCMRAKCMKTWFV